MSQQASPKRRCYLPKDMASRKTPVRRINVTTLLFAKKLATERAAERRLVTVYCIANWIASITDRTCCRAATGHCILHSELNCEYNWQNVLQSGDCHCILHSELNCEYNWLQESCKENPTFCTTDNLVYFVKLYMFRAYPGPISGGTTVCVQQLVLINLFRWLSVVLVGSNPPSTSYQLCSKLVLPYTIISKWTVNKT